MDDSQYNIVLKHMQVHTLKVRQVPFQSNAQLEVKTGLDTEIVNNKRHHVGFMIIWFCHDNDDSAHLD